MGHTWRIVTIYHLLKYVDMENLLITNVKLLRLSISEKLVMVNQLDRSRETSLAYTQLEESFMFLGKVLGSLGEPNPYPKDSAKDEVNEKISDSCAPNKVKMPTGSPLKKVKDVRELLQVLISSSIWNLLMDRFSTPGQPFVKYNNMGWVFVTRSLTNLYASKMWLGMELNNLSLGEKVDEKTDNAYPIDEAEAVDPPAKGEAAGLPEPGAAIKKTKATPNKGTKGKGKAKKAE